MQQLRVYTIGVDALPVVGLKVILFTQVNVDYTVGMVDKEFYNVEHPDIWDGQPTIDLTEFHNMRSNSEISGYCLHVEESALIRGTKWCYHYDLESIVNPTEFPFTNEIYWNTGLELGLFRASQIDKSYTHPPERLDMDDIEHTIYSVMFNFNRFTVDLVRFINPHTKNEMRREYRVTHIE